MNRVQLISLKFIIAGVLAISLFSCKTTIKVPEKKPLYEVLLQQSNGGANINFYEILSEANEIKMLLKDEKLKGKITATDVNESNFVVLNMGEKPTSGYAITVESVTETADEIVLKVKEIVPDSDAMLMQLISYPYTVVKINSKKTIVVK